MEARAARRAGAALALRLAIASATLAGALAPRAANAEARSDAFGADGLAVARALGSERDVIVFPATGRPAPAPTLLGATLAPGVPPGRVIGVLRDPAAMRVALPSLVRADVIATRAATGGARDRLLAWELEIPLFNLAGKAWLVTGNDTVELDLVEGAFAPGRVRFQVSWEEGAGASLVACETRVDFRSAGFILRRLARHDPWAESAMTAAATWVLMRAVVLAAGAPVGGPAPRPAGVMRPPPLASLDPQPIAADALAPLRDRGRLAIVHRAPGGGRLAFVSVAAAIEGLAPAAVARRLAAPESWLAFPGWKTLRRHAAEPNVFDVEDDIALVDLDATWRWSPGPAAEAIAGRIGGAVLRWDVMPPRAQGAPVLAVLSMHPHLDAAGFIERRMVAAEPLLEHALALAMVYADAAAVADALTTSPSIDLRK
jgi:hypothetical protein